MTTTATFSMKGFEDLLEAIVALGRDVDAAAAEAAQAGGEVLRQGMQQRAPVDTGNLRDHIAVLGPKRDGNYTYVVVGVVKADETTARYANAQEYGTTRMAAHPYIRPTIAADKAAARRAAIEALKGWL